MYTSIHLVCDAPTSLEDMPESHAQIQVWLCWHFGWQDQCKHGPSKNEKLRV